LHSKEIKPLIYATKN